MIYIDFECLASPPQRRHEGAGSSTPLLLGVLWPDDTITQFIFDERLGDAARADRERCRAAPLNEAVAEIVQRASELGCFIAECRRQRWRRPGSRRGSGAGREHSLQMWA